VVNLLDFNYSIQYVFNMIKKSYNRRNTSINLYTLLLFQCSKWAQYKVEIKHSKTTIKFLMVM